MINNSSVATASKTTPKEYTVKARICGHGSQECGQISDWINIAGWCLIWSVYSSQKCCWTVPEVSGGHTRHVFTQTYRFCIELMTIWPGFHRAFPTLHIGCSNDSWFGFVGRYRLETSWLVRVKLLCRSRCQGIKLNLQTSWNWTRSWEVGPPRLGPLSL